MKNDITVIITVRDRDTQRLENQLKSIRENGANPNFIIVDYGSEPKYAKPLESLATQYKCEYIHIYSEGRPWNKCHAINIAVKKSETPFIVTSDMDNIYSTNPFSYCLNNFQKNKFYSIEEFWMKKRGNYFNASPAGHGNYGMYLFTDKTAYSKTGGYDERIVYWGMEDLDWPERLKKIGYTQEWLPEEHKIYHQWHPSVSNSIYRPDNAAKNTMRVCMENMFTPTSNREWGKQINKDSRPILSLIETKTTAFDIQFKPNAFINYFETQKLTDLKGKGFIKVNIGARHIKRPLNALRSFTQNILRPITALTGNTISDKINYNFDFFYSFIPVFERQGLTDYYITPDTSTIYLLWE